MHISGLWVHLHPQRDIKLHPWVLPPSFSRKMGEVETVEAEKMGWIYLPRGTFYPTLPYYGFVLRRVRPTEHPL